MVPAARIYHKVGRSFAGATRSATYYYARNRLLLLRLHAGKHYLRGYVNAAMANLRGTARPLRRFEPADLCLVLRAMRDDVLGQFGSATDL